MQLANLVEQTEAVELRPLQPDIEEDQARDAIADRCQRAVAVIGGARFMALVAQNSGDKLANVFLVVDDEYVRRHPEPFLLFLLRRLPRESLLFLLPAP